MKKLFIMLTGLVLVTQSIYTEQSVNPDFRKFEIPRDKLAAGRSLKEILEQHGSTTQSGNFIVTTDGILENDTPPAKMLASLQHRATQFKLAKDSTVVNDLNNKNRTDTACVLVHYIQRTYGHEKSPLCAFVTDLVREHQETALINTEALRLASDAACKKGAQELLKTMCQYKGVLLFFDTLLEKLWEEMIYWFALESYATTPD